MAAAMHDASSDFRDFVKCSLVSVSVLVGDGLSPAHDLGFMPRRVLRRYLTPDRLQSLLPHPQDWKTVSHGYLAVFSILISIQEDAYIPYFLQFNNLDDEHLPFQHVEDWPPNCKKFFKQFYDAQWPFCPQPLKRERLNDTRFLPEAILPITNCQALKEDVISSTYVVEIHPEYNLLLDVSGS